MTTIAMTIWENRISPVFDAAHHLLVANIEDGRVIDRSLCSFNPDNMTSLIGLLKDRNVNVLVCGAISEVPALMLSETDVELIPFVTGNTDQVLGAMAAGRSVIPRFLMPGCGRGRHGGCKGNRCRRRTLLDEGESGP
jgi:predicted Fe-Mo cluster-binding NifX family protein